MIPSPSSTRVTWTFLAAVGNFLDTISPESEKKVRTNVLRYCKG